MYENLIIKAIYYSRGEGRGVDMTGVDEKYFSYSLTSNREATLAALMTADTIRLIKVTLLSIICFHLWPRQKVGARVAKGIRKRQSAQHGSIMMACI